MNFIDNFINDCDIALKTLSNKKSGTGRTYPPEPGEKNTEKLTAEEKKISIQMMRVNLAGEVAAQALYRGQSLVCKDADIKKHLIEAGEEETEKQVVAHLDRHLDKISPKDKKTIEILKTMKEDEDLHARQAVDKGSEELKIPVKKIMQFTAKMMTSTSKYI